MLALALGLVKVHKARLRVPNTNHNNLAAYILLTLPQVHRERARGQRDLCLDFVLQYVGSQAVVMNSVFSVRGT